MRMTSLIHTCLKCLQFDKTGLRSTEGQARYSASVSRNTCGGSVLHDATILPVAQLNLWVLHRNTASVAYRSVEVTDAVIDVLTGLRDYMQDKCEPPVYVSDRRFMKSIQMMQVAAHADGRTAVSADAPLPVHPNLK